MNYEIVDITFILCVNGQRRRAPPDQLRQRSPLDKDSTLQIQSISGTFLFYSEIDPCIKLSLNKISVPSKSTTNAINTTFMLMDYLATFPDGFLHYHAVNIPCPVPGSNSNSRLIHLRKTTRTNTQNPCACMSYATSSRTSC